MKLRIEIAHGNPDEVILRAAEMTDDIRRLQRVIESATGGVSELALSVGEREYFVPISDILFFETADSKVYAHTADRMLVSEDKLYELAKCLPRSFVRVSKSCLVNSARVESIRRSITGTAEACFCGSDKKAYISRMYYKDLKEIIYETRLQK